MSDLVAFLRARYAEARDRQMRTFRDTWEFGAACPVCERPTESVVRYGGGYGPLASFKPCGHAVYDPALLARFEKVNPDQDVLADLDSKLAIVEMHLPEEISEHSRRSWRSFTVQCAGESWKVYGDAENCVEYPCRTLRLLAVPFAAHPDYDERWRPQT